MPNCISVIVCIIRLALLLCIYNKYQLYDVVLLPSYLSIVFEWLILSMLRSKEPSVKVGISQRRRQSKGGRQSEGIQSNECQGGHQRMSQNNIK